MGVSQEICPDAPNVWMIYLHYIGEKWPHEQGEMARFFSVTFLGVLSDPFMG